MAKIKMILEFNAPLGMEKWTPQEQRQELFQAFRQRLLIGYLQSQSKVLVRLGEVEIANQSLAYYKAWEEAIESMNWTHEIVEENNAPVATT